MEIDEILFETSSYLTDPACLAHEAFWKSQVVEAVAAKVFLWLKMFVFASLALFSSLPGIAIRKSACWLQENPYLKEVHGSGIELSQDLSFSLFSWNVCCVAGGYPITDGGVAPWRERLDLIIQKIIKTNGDINCLYELFDFSAASHVKEKLKEAGYTHFYYNIGPQGLGVSSGILVASKYKIENPEFVLFPESTRVGRAQFANKGIFSFDVLSQEKPFARIYATHLIHSELPEFPTDVELDARRAQLRFCADKISQVRDRCLILTGDLNCECDPADFGCVEGNLFQEKTWDGDANCAPLVNKPISHALNLDHTMVREGTAQKIESILVKDLTLSDHAGILSRITVNNRSAIRTETPQLACSK